MFAEPVENTHTPPAEKSPGQEHSATATAIPSTKMNYPRGPHRDQVLGVVLYVGNFSETEFFFHFMFFMRHFKVPRGTGLYPPFTLWHIKCISNVCCPLIQACLFSPGLLFP